MVSLNMHPIQPCSSPTTSSQYSVLIRGPLSTSGVTELFFFLSVKDRPGLAHASIPSSRWWS